MTTLLASLLLVDRRAERGRETKLDLIFNVLYRFSSFSRVRDRTCHDKFNLSPCICCTGMLSSCFCFPATATAVVVSATYISCIAAVLSSLWQNIFAVSCLSTQTTTVCFIVYRLLLHCVLLHPHSRF